MRCLQPRQFGLRYEAEHHEGHFYLLTNKDGARNNKLMRCQASYYYCDSSRSRLVHSLTFYIVFG